MVTEAALTRYIQEHQAPQSALSRDFWREQAEAARQHRPPVQAKAAEAAELKKLRERVAKLERLVCGPNSVLIKAILARALAIDVIEPSRSSAIRSVPSTQ